MGRGGCKINGVLDKPDKRRITEPSETMECVRKFTCSGGESGIQQLHNTHNRDSSMGHCVLRQVLTR